MKREDAEEFTQSLGQIVGGSYRLIAQAKKLGVPKALGMSVPQWVNEHLGGYARLSAADRREIVKELAAEGMSTREIGEIVGTGKSSVARDLSVPSGTREDNFDSIPATDEASIVPNGTGDEKPLDTVAILAAGEKVRNEAERIEKKEEKKAEREAELERQKADIEAGKVADPEGPFDIICMDPPWPYGTKYDPNGRRSANPYPEMSLEEIAALPVAEKAAPDAFLWLWTTHKFMRHSFVLLDKWGFEDKAILTWAKDKMGIGTWLRSQSEFCIMAVRGKPTAHLTNQTTILSGPLREHSRKPDEFYALVEGLCIGDRRYDWFSREQRPGWVCGGNDPERFAA